uniref:CRC domain-containing protein n=2 Tax=Eptatretus burgeri TaxID=7764 RepID=A0A8C4QKN8_EPTBU
MAAREVRPTGGGGERRAILNNVHLIGSRRTSRRRLEGRGAALEGGIDRRLDRGVLWYERDMKADQMEQEKEGEEGLHDVPCVNGPELVGGLKSEAAQTFPQGLASADLTAQGGLLPVATCQQPQQQRTLRPSFSSGENALVTLPAKSLETLGASGGDLRKEGQQQPLFFTVPGPRKPTEAVPESSASSESQGQPLLVAVQTVGGQGAERRLLMTVPSKVAPAGGDVKTGVVSKVSAVTAGPVGRQQGVRLVPVVGGTNDASRATGAASSSTPITAVPVTRMVTMPGMGPVLAKFIFKPVSGNRPSGRPQDTPGTPSTPTKTLTLSQLSLVSSPGRPPGPAKIAISPLKSPAKVTVVPIATAGSSPQKRLLTALPQPLVPSTLLSAQPPTSTVSEALSLASSVSATSSSVQTLAQVCPVPGGLKTLSVPVSGAPPLHQITVPGSKFQYIRLVQPSLAGKVVGGQIVRPTVPIAPASRQVTPGSAVLSSQILPSQGVSTTQQQQAPSQPTSIAMAFTSGQSAPQRLIMPASSVPSVRPTLARLPPGTLISTAPGSSRVVHAMLPTQLFPQLQQSTTTAKHQVPVPVIPAQNRIPVNGITATEALSRTRKPCNCTKSQCLKLYCECFSNGEFCSTCNCRNCFNNLAHEVERQRAIKSCLGRNPEAFRPKIGKGKEGEAERRHNKGCHCKRSGCLKNYCECYEAKIMCSSMCKCVGCKNMEDSQERKTLMHLADAAEVRVQQQAAARTKLSQISDLPARTPHIPGTQRGEAHGRAR